MRNIWIIATREFKGYFISPVAYVVAAAIYLVLGGIFFINIYFGLQGSQIAPDGRMVLGPLVTILLFATPALTMHLLADEQRMGTIELLLTAPVNDWELVIGKWLGSAAFVILLLAITWVYPLILNRMTSPGIDQGVLLSAYLGLTLLSLAMLAVGLLISSLFKNSVAAFFGSLGALLVLWIIGAMGSGNGAGSEVLSYLSLVDHYYNNMYQGLINLSDIVYFVSLTILSLVIASQVIESRRWR
jgi:ABC-2 type transport system permease protein